MAFNKKEVSHFTLIERHNISLKITTSIYFKIGEAIAKTLNVDILVATTLNSKWI